MGIVDARRTEHIAQGGRRRLPTGQTLREHDAHRRARAKATRSDPKLGLQEPAQPYTKTTHESIPQYERTHDCLFERCFPPFSPFRMTYRHRESRPSPQRASQACTSSSGCCCTGTSRYPRLEAHPEPSSPPRPSPLSFLPCVSPCSSTRRTAKRRETSARTWRGSRGLIMRGALPAYQPGVDRSTSRWLQYEPVQSTSK